MLTELRKLIASWLLRLTMSVLPEGELKNNFSVFICENIVKL
jgi:hypothetical protein